MSKRRSGFTLTELVVVMGIIILFIAVAVPTIRALTGTGSINFAKNAVSALLVRAREDAIANQEVRGVVFYLEPNTDRVVGLLVHQATVQDSWFPGAVMLDAIPGRDSLALPNGVRLQTICNALNQNTTGNSGDRYMGFNTQYGVGPYTYTNSLSQTITVNPPKVGGCILFDGNGRLLVVPYGFQFSIPASYSLSLIATEFGVQPSAITGGNSNNYFHSTGLAPYGATTVPGARSGIIGAAANGALFYNRQSGVNMALSQVGVVLFDSSTFKSLGFNDDDWDYQNSSAAGGSYSSAAGSGAQNWATVSEQTEENWLDTNSTPVLINRADGSLIRAE